MVLFTADFTDDLADDVADDLADDLADGLADDLADDLPEESYEIHIDDRQGLTTQEGWSMSILLGSIFSVCCCQIFGLMATVSSVMAYVDIKVRYR